MELVANDTPMPNSDPSATDTAAGPNPSATDAADTHAPAKDSGDSQSDAARMFRLFAGLDTHHGTYNAAATTEKANGKTEIKKTAQTVKTAPSVDLWQQHLDGKRPLGISPVRADSTSLWGCIDVDDYVALSHTDLATKISETGLPLIVCRSKSGGAHLFLLLSEPMPTGDMMEYLKGMRSVLGLPDDTETFPYDAKPNGSGWLNMPYFHADGGNRYAVGSNGKGFSLNRFLSTAEANRVSPGDLADLIANAKAVADKSDGDEGTDRDGTMADFEEWLAGPSALLRLEKAPPKKADKSLYGLAKDIGRFLKELPLDLPAVKAQAEAAWLKRGKALDEFDMQWDRGIRDGERAGNPPWPRSRRPEHGPKLEDFFSYMLSLVYIYSPTGDVWPTARINARFGERYLDGKPVPASVWLDNVRPVEQMTWLPGEPQVIRDRLVAEGGWKAEAGTAVFNHYKPPIVSPVENVDASPWLDHIRRIYPDEADHIVKWCAHRVQFPGQKLNHALVLGGNQGIGKDSLLAPVRHAIGAWNMQEVNPQQLMGRFRGFLKAVILRVNEARDLGDNSRHTFYTDTKEIIAGNETHLIDEKNQKEYYITNVCGVVLTTNHKSDGIYLPADDRRHFVAWSDLTASDFDEDYFVRLHGWFDDGGKDHVAAYLLAYDLSGFNPKAPPPKTPAFWEIVSSNRPTEDAELLDALERLGNPPAITIDLVAMAATGTDFGNWLRDKANTRRVKRRFESAGYVSVNNDDAKHGLWQVDGKRCAVYARADLSRPERLSAAAKVPRSPV